MPLARIGSTLLFFVHVPKTGGTSIESYLRTKGPLGLAGTRHGWSRTTPQHIHADIHGELVPPGLYDQGFAVIRDPKARLLSEFKMRAEPLRFKPRPMGLARLAGYKAKGKAAYGIRLRHRIDYFDFDDWVTRVFEEYRRDPFYKDNHMRATGPVRQPRPAALPVRGRAGQGVSLDRRGDGHRTFQWRVLRAAFRPDGDLVLPGDRCTHSRILPRRL